MRAETETENFMAVVEKKASFYKGTMKRTGRLDPGKLRELHEYFANAHEPPKKLELTGDCWQLSC